MRRARNTIIMLAICSAIFPTAGMQAGKVLKEKAVGIATMDVAGDAKGKDFEAVFEGIGKEDMDEITKLLKDAFSLDNLSFEKLEAASGMIFSSIEDGSPYMDEIFDKEALKKLEDIIMKNIEQQ